MCASLWPDRVSAVTGIRFEYSPARRDERYTGDRSAFDVFIEHLTPAGEPGFIGIEVKYHESLEQQAREPKPRSLQLTREMGCFDAERVQELQAKPLEQIWRDHLLAGAMLVVEPKWKSGLYVFLYPQDNVPCQHAVAAYQRCLTDSDTFAVVTLEKVVTALRTQTNAEWVKALARRYLAWQRVEQAR